jgi:D-glycero-D-manno-heptose 1,7-bisphosphate phosphatase
VSLKLILLDRDGVINEKIDEGYVNSLENFILKPGIFEFLKLIEGYGIRTAIVTNQQGLGKLTTSYTEFFRIHGFFADECARQSITPPTLFYCPHIAGTCLCRKPETGMLLAALEYSQVFPQEVLLIGDSETDVSAAKSIGIQSIHLSSNSLHTKCNCGAEFHLSTIDSCAKLLTIEFTSTNFK